MHKPERVSSQPLPEQDLSPLLEQERQQQALPAGTVHVSLVDWAKYVAEHLRGDRSLDGKLLKASTYNRLHRGTPIEGTQESYALGWVLLNRSWAKGDRPEDVGRCLHHSGSNNSWFSLVWVAPERDTAVLCTTNIGGDTIFPKIDALTWAVIQNHFNL